MHNKHTKWNSSDQYDRDDKKNGAKISRRYEETSCYVLHTWIYNKRDNLVYDLASCKAIFITRLCSSHRGLLVLNWSVNRISW